MAGRPIIALISLVLVAAGVLFQFFVILSGATLGGIENKVYFLRAHTGTGNGGSNIANSYPYTAWTYFALAQYDPSSNKLVALGPTQAALPFYPQGNFDAFGDNVPAAFLGTHKYYYESRFVFAFYLIALFFAVISFFLGMLALCSRIGGYLSGVMIFIAFIFQGLAAALMTAWTVQARNVFNSSGSSASLGQYAYGFTWGATAAYFICSILFCVGGSMGKNKGTYPSEKKSMFSRNRSNRDGVKDEYS